jgi:hypothetical protein
MHQGRHDLARLHGPGSMPSARGFSSRDMRTASFMESCFATASQYASALVSWEGYDGASHLNF